MKKTTLEYPFKETMLKLFIYYGGIQDQHVINNCLKLLRNYNTLILKQYQS